VGGSRLFYFSPAFAATTQCRNQDATQNANVEKHSPSFEHSMLFSGLGTVHRPMGGTSRKFMEIHTTQIVSKGITRLQMRIDCITPFEIRNALVTPLKNYGRELQNHGRGCTRTRLGKLLLEKCLFGVGGAEEFHVASKTIIGVQRALNVIGIVTSSF